MPPITVTARPGAPEDTAADTRVVGLFEGETLADPALQALVELGEAKPGLKKVAVKHEDAPGGGQRRVLIAGLGKRDEFDAEKARVAAAAVAGGRRSWAPSRSRGRAPRRRRAAPSSRARCSASTASTASSPSTTTNDERAASSRSRSPARRRRAS